MASSRLARPAIALAVVAMFSGCATWNDMDRSEKGTAVGATSGALVGAAVGGPVGAVVGAGAGGYVGHHQGFTNDSRDVRAAAGADPRDSYHARDAQRARNDARDVDARDSFHGRDTGTVRDSAASRASSGVDPRDSFHSRDTSTSASTPAIDSASVRSIQQALADRGYDVGPVDGVWGPRTESALRQFQQSQGLAQTGRADGRTMAALGVADRGNVATGATTSDAERADRTLNGADVNRDATLPR